MVGGICWTVDAGRSWGKALGSLAAGRAAWPRGAFGGVSPGQLDGCCSFALRGDRPLAPVFFQDKRPEEQLGRARAMGRGWGLSLAECDAGSRVRVGGSWGYPLHQDHHRRVGDSHAMLTVEACQPWHGPHHCAPL